MINQIIKFYGVNMSEAKEQDINNFTSFNHFLPENLNLPFALLLMMKMRLLAQLMALSVKLD